MEKEIKALKEVYLNLWLRGLLFSSLGILNMLYVISAIYDMHNGEDVPWMIFVNILGVIIFSRSSVQLQNQRRIVFAKIKKILI